MRPSVDVIIPVHNEAAFMPGALYRLLADIERVAADITVILAENGSPDGTGDLAERLAAGDRRLRVLRLPDPDYGAAMRAGFAAAGATWVVNFDIDYFSADFLTSALALAGEADIVLASKRAPGADDRRALLRRTGTLGFNLIIRLLFRSAVSDTHGMKLIRRELIDQLASQVISTQDLFDTELVIRAERRGARIAEVPATVEELREARSSFLGRVPRTLRGLWKIRRALSAEARSDV